MPSLYEYIMLQSNRLDGIGALARMFISTPGAPTNDTELLSFETFLTMESPNGRTLECLLKAKKEFYN